jgi:hypothetical protein
VTISANAVQYDIFPMSLLVSVITSSSNKNYDGQEASVSYSFAPAIDTNGSDSSGNFDLPYDETGTITLNYTDSAGNVSTNTPVNASRYSVAVETANISNASGLDTSGNYSIISNGASFTISKRAVGITASVASKVYDGSSSAGALTAAISSGLVGTENLVLNATAGNYNSKNVGENYQTRVTLSLSNGTSGLASNYFISNGSTEISFIDLAQGVITPKRLTATSSDWTSVVGQTNYYGLSKTYNGNSTFTSPNTNARLVNWDAQDTSSPVIAGDLVTISGNPEWGASSKHVGTELTLTAAEGTEFSLTNNEDGNYVLDQPSFIGTIEKAPLTVSATNQNLIYGRTLDETAWRAAPLANGDSIASVTLSDSGNVLHVGTYTLTPSAAVGADLDSFDPQDYDITYVTGTLIIGQKNLSITANDQTITYGDSTVRGSSDQFTQIGLENNETIGSVTIAAENENAGTRALTASAATGGTFRASDYNIS